MVSFTKTNSILFSLEKSFSLLCLVPTVAEMTHFTFNETLNINDLLLVMWQHADMLLCLYISDEGYRFYPIEPLLFFLFSIGPHVIELSEPHKPLMSQSMRYSISPLQHGCLPFLLLACLLRPSFQLSHPICVSSAPSTSVYVTVCLVGHCVGRRNCLRCSMNPPSPRL